MPGAQAQRLIAALDDYIASYTGDTGTRDGSVRGSVAGPMTQIVGDAQKLREKLTGAYDQGTDRQTPGAAAVARAGGAAGGFAGGRSRARGSMTGAGA